MEEAAAVTGAMTNVAIASDPLPEAQRNGIDVNELRLVLIGMTGEGKSATGNTILNGKHFVSQAGLASITEQCQFSTNEVSDRKVLVVDTPGFLDTTKNKETMDKEIKKCIAIASPGPHAFLLVTSVESRYTEQVATVFSEIDAMFGENLTKFLIVIFTHKESLADTSLPEFTAKASGKMKEILTSAAGGCIAFNNKGNDEEKMEYVKTLLCRTEKMRKQNNDGHFTSEMFEEAERIMQKRIKEGLKEEERRKKIQKEQSLKRKNMEENFLKRLKAQDEVKLNELEAEREKKRTFYSEKEKELEELVRKKMEKELIKNKLIEQHKSEQGGDGFFTEASLTEIENEIGGILKKKKRIENEIIDETLSMSVRMEERNKIESGAISPFANFFQRAVGKGERFLKFFKQSSKSWTLSK